MMDKGYLNISYDLSRNLITLEIDKINLKSFAFNVISGRFYKDSNILEKILSWEDRYRKVKNLNNSAYEDWEKIELNVEQKILHHIEKDHVDKREMNYFEKINGLVKHFNHFVGIQILEFLREKATKRSVNDIPMLLKNLVITNQGTINLRSTILKIVNNKDLTTVNRFLVACYYFIDKKLILNLFNDLSKMKKKISFKYDCTEAFALKFWLFQIKSSINNKKTELINMLSDESEQLISSKKPETLNSYIKTAINVNNEIGVQYIWSCSANKGDALKITEELLERIFVNEEMTNIGIYLLSKVSETTFMNFSNSLKCTILHYVVKKLRWRSYFIKVFDVSRPNFKCCDYMKILLSITLTTSKDYPKYTTKEIVNYFFSCFAHQADEVTFHYFDDNLNYLAILETPFAESKIELVEMLLCYGKGESEKNEFFKFFGGSLFEKPFKCGNFLFVDWALKAIYKEEKQIEEQQRKLFFFHGFSFFVENVKMLNRDSIENFLNWASRFATETEIQIFKYHLFQIKEGFVIKHFLFDQKDDDDFDSLEKLNDILSLCLGNFERTNIIKMIKFEAKKKEINLLTIQCYENIRDYVMNSKWKILDKLIEWRACTGNEKRSIAVKLLTDRIVLNHIITINNFRFIYSFFDFIQNTLSVDKKESVLGIFKNHIFKRLSKEYLKKKNTKELDNIIELSRKCRPLSQQLRDWKDMIKMPTTEYFMSKDFSSEAYERFRLWKIT